MNAGSVRRGGAALTMLASLSGCPRGVGAPPPARASAVTHAPAAALEAVPRSALCFTEGAPVTSAGGAIHVEAGGVRAFAAGDRSSSAELAFTYRGPSAFEAPLANGELRRQVGLKLRAQDTCNVVYVMWHLEPTQTVAVSVKRNAGMSAHAACGDGGYVNVQAEASARPPAVAAGVPHVMRADLDGRTLRVIADGDVVWRGQLPTVALDLEGPVGLRTDNGTFDLELRTTRHAGDSPCHADDGGATSLTDGFAVNHGRSSVVTAATNRHGR